MNQKGFIELVIMNQIGDVVKLHPYLSFPLMCTAIELLGSCIDTRAIPFDKQGEIRARFDMAINTLFPIKYHRFAGKNNETGFDLYSMLRCGMTHQFLPKSGLHLGERKHTYENINIFGQRVEVRHLGISHGGILVIADELFDDIKNAAQMVIDKIDKGEIVQRFSLAV